MPAPNKREKNRRLFIAMMDERGLTREATATILHVTVNAIKAWVKKEGVAGANPVPLWAIELLGFKAPMPGNREFDPSRDLIISGPAYPQPPSNAVRALRKLIAAR